MEEMADSDEMVMMVHEFPRMLLHRLGRALEERKAVRKAGTEQPAARRRG